jgi:hypothetical protein
MRLAPRTVLVLAAALALFLLAGCGKKEWPRPQAHTQAFQWETVSATREGDCLEVRASMGGRWQNLGGVVLELAPAGPEDCPGCPFSPTQRVDFPLDSPTLSRQGEDVALKQCGLEPGTPYRWRLVGRNVAPMGRDAVSRVYTVAP